MQMQPIEVSRRPINFSIMFVFTRRRSTNVWRVPPYKGGEGQDKLVSWVEQKPQAHSEEHARSIDGSSIGLPIIPMHIHIIFMISLHARPEEAIHNPSDSLGSEKWFLECLRLTYLPQACCEMPVKVWM